MTEHAIACESIDFKVHCDQLTLYGTGCDRRQLQDNWNPAVNKKLPWSTKVFVRTVRDIQYHDVASSGTFADKFLDRHSL